MKSSFFIPSILFIPFDFTKLLHKCHVLVGLWDYKLGWDGVRVHHVARLQPDAARAPVAGAALDPRVDDLRHARRRWLAVVCHGDRHPTVRRSYALRGGGHRGSGGSSGNRGVPFPEEADQPQTPLRHRAALLGQTAASGPFLFSVRPYDNGLCGSAVAGGLLSEPAVRIAVLRREHRALARPAGDAFLE